MDSNLLKLLALVALVFCITYDPRSGKLDKYISGDGTCCNRVDYMARHPDQCQPPHFQGVQFADPNYGCPKPAPKMHNGAIY